MGVADGIAGIFAARDDVMLKNRKGLAKLSLQSGSPVLPVFNVGTTDMYYICADPCGCLKTVSRLIKASLFCFCGSFGPIPFRAQMTSVLGKAAQPQKTFEQPEASDIDQLHDEILNNMHQAFESHKAAFGAKDRTVEFS